MPEEEKVNKFARAVVWFLVIISVIAISISSIKYYLKKDFLLVDKIPCKNSLINCFAPDADGEDPYKVLVFDKSVTLNCKEKDASCNVDDICDASASGKCKTIGCNDGVNYIPKGYTTSEKCFEEK